MSAIRIAIDIGGTFTDAVVLDEATGDIRAWKVLSTPSDPSKGFIHAIDRILAESDVEVGDVAYVVHATTVATNAIIEGKGERTGMILTRGFGDLMEIQRQVRPTLYDLDFEKTPALVPRGLCAEVRERLSYAGEVLEPLDEADVQAAIAVFREHDVRSVAVCLLHSYVNAAHEQRIGQLLREGLPGASVSLSSDICPEFREYFRASTTAINATIRPIVADYLNRIEGQLADRGLPGRVLVMQSNGGVLTFETAREKPVFMVESGPAAGVIAAAYIGAEIGEHNLLSFDMGGTTAKAGMIRNGSPHVTREFEVGAVASSGSSGRTKASGYPIRTPVIDLVEIGAGGGSIAWVDSGDVLRVGPQSAGADPGPVCYGLGGTNPTVTDANLVLGRLNPEYFLGGEMNLDVEAARAAIARTCGDPLGLDVTEAAHGIVEIANTAMTNALRIVSVQRGFDAREFALVGFGGAGPLHINRLAEELGVRVAIVPVNAGVASALGLLVTDLRHENSVTRITSAAHADAAQLNELLSDLAAQGSRTLSRDGVGAEAISHEVEIDARYVGQSYELPVPVAELPLTGDDAPAAIVEAFHAEHARAYGRADQDQPVEFVNFRVASIGRIPTPALAGARRASDRSADALRGERGVFFREAGGFVPTPVYDRYGIAAGDRVLGPAILEEVESTVVVHPGFEAVADEFGNILLRRNDEAVTAVDASAPSSQLSTEQLIELLGDMQLIRAFDSQLKRLYTSGLVRGSSHPALGQEAAAVGACSALEPGDYITSTHRGHGHAIAKGADVRRMMAELFGRVDGYCRGKGGSMHIADFGAGMLGANGIVGGGFGIATGAALSSQLRGSGQVALCFFGDGAVNQGGMLELGNLAGIWRLPLVLVCENNQFAMSARPDDMTAVDSLVTRGNGIGVPGVEIDGMDVLAVYDAVASAAATARAGDGPRMVVATCYRYEGHFAGDTLAYRDEAEADKWRSLDPIAAFARRLVDGGHLTADAVKDLAATAAAAIDDAIEYARNSPPPPAEQAMEDIIA